MGVPLVVLFPLFEGYKLCRLSKRIEDDLVGGFAESLSGVVGSKKSRWEERSYPWIVVDGKKITVSSQDYGKVEPGDQVSVEYLPRSDVAVLVRKHRGSVLGL